MQYAGHYRPHQIEPAKEKVRIAFAYKNFAAKKGISHIGLGVSIDNTRRTLVDHGIWCTVWPIVSVGDLEAQLDRDLNSALHHHKPPISHVVISAPWIDPTAIGQLARKHDLVQFVVLSHSNVGFLQADANGVANMRGYLELQVGIHNFAFAANSNRFVEWVQRAYGVKCWLLPNLYNLRDVGNQPRRPWTGGVLRIGCFGAIRPQKNMMTSVAAAMEIATRMRAADTEIWISSGRPEGGGSILVAIQNMVRGVPGVKLVENPWQSWAAFRKTVAHMDLLIQPSYTESFNIVTADGVAEGVASVVSEAIDWVPDRWKADSDGASDVARVGTYLIGDHYAAAEGLASLRSYVADGVRLWFDFLRIPCVC